jgi:hypothetical protein
VSTCLLIACPALMMAAVMLRLKAWLRAALFAVVIVGELSAIANVTVEHVRGEVIAFTG